MDDRWMGMTFFLSSSIESRTGSDRDDSVEVWGDKSRGFNLLRQLWNTCQI